jgi:hypothetical protein
VYQSVFSQFETTVLYQQAPMVLLSLIFLMLGGTLLLIGLGVVREVRSASATVIGVVALAAALLVRDMGLVAAYRLLFGLAGVLVIAGPVAAVAGAIRLDRLRV